MRCTRKLAFAVAVSLFVTLACQRVEEPGSSVNEPSSATAQRQSGGPPSADRESPPPSATPEPVPVAAKSAQAASPEATPDAGRCVAPLASPPPPSAHPAADCPRDPLKAPTPLTRGKVAFPEAPGAPTLDVEIADGPAEHERGLMYRTSLGKMRGMIFVWDDERVRTFWMKNTCLPLDMLYIAKDGTVVGLLEQVPVLNEAPRAVRCPAGYVLEVNAGWSRQHGVKPGMKAAIAL